MLVAVDEPGRQGLGPDRLGILLEDFEQRRVVVPFGSDDFLAGHEDIGVLGEAEADFGQGHQAGIEGDHVEIGSLRIGEYFDQLGGGHVVAGGSVEIVVVESLQAAAVVPQHQRVVFGGGLIDRPVDEVGQCLGVTGVEFTEQFELGRDHVGVGIGRDERSTGVSPGRLRPAPGGVGAPRGTLVPEYRQVDRPRQCGDRGFHFVDVGKREALEIAGGDVDHHGPGVRVALAGTLFAPGGRFGMRHVEGDVVGIRLASGPADTGVP